MPLTSKQFILWGIKSSHLPLCPEKGDGGMDMVGPWLSLPGFSPAPSSSPCVPVYVCFPYSHAGPTILPSQDITWKCIYRDTSVLQWDVSPFQTLALAFPSYPESCSLPCTPGNILLILQNPAQLSLSPRSLPWLPRHPRPAKPLLSPWLPTWDQKSCLTQHSLNCWPTASWGRWMLVLLIH